MNEAHMDHHEHKQQTGFDWYRVGLWGAIGIISYFLITEHRAHVIQFLPFLLLLACPFMHLFMHGGHGHGGHSHESRDQKIPSDHEHGAEKNKERK